MKQIFGLVTVFFIMLFNVQAQEWSYQEDFVTILDSSLHGPHGVVVTPDDKIWVGWYGYTDEIITTSGDTIQTCPIYIYNSDGTLYHQINFLTYNSITDTLINFCRGMSLDNNGNVLYTAWDELWRINYQTYEALNKIVPVVAVTLTEAACDENGYIYITHVIPDGRPFYIYDKNFILYSYVANSVRTTQRSIVTSPDGRDVYLGKIYGGPADDDNGIIHYHSDTGPGGVYTKVDSSHTDIWGQCLDWDRSGLLWIGSYWDIVPDDSSGWYALDPTQNFKIVNEIGRNVDINPNINPQPPIEGTYYAPRGAAWSLDGSFMYTADFDGHVIKKWYNPDPQISNIQLSVGIHNFFSGDTIKVAVDVSFNTYSSYSSTEIDISGFRGQLEFLDVVTDSSLIGDAGWVTEVNDTDNLLEIASAGSNNINGSGVLLWLLFAIPDTASTSFVPINLDYGIFNTGTTPTSLTSGGINIETFTINFGDVDLSGTVQAYDASLILKYLVDMIELSEQQRQNANVSIDTTVSGLDATLILQYVVGIIDTLPYDGSNSKFIAYGSLSMEDQNVQPGETVELTIYIAEGSNIYSFEGELSFDPSHLTFNEIIWSSLLDNFTKELNTLEGTIKFAGAGLQQDGEEGIFGTAFFTVDENFDLDSTVVSLNELRWNEGVLMKDIAHATLSKVTAINRFEGKIPSSFALQQNFPNPFNPRTRIRFSLPKASHVNITIFNNIGQKVAIIIDNFQQAGCHEVTFDAGHLVSGVYYYQFKADGYLQVRKMLLMK